jgi:Asp-tRNA(Asn)/Glu-tRNA(Gln) amidotransferase A subunit family amidase
LTGLRVATWFDDDACPIDAEYRGMLRDAADAFADAGAHVDDAHVEDAHVEDAHPAVGFGAHTELYTRLIASAVSPIMPHERAEQIRAGISRGSVTTSNVRRCDRTGASGSSGTTCSSRRPGARRRSNTITPAT